MAQSPNQKKCIAILGAGSWGTALAMHAARLGHTVRLWGRSASVMEDMQANRCNKRYLPGMAYPELLTPTSDLSAALSGVDEILVVVPSHAFYELLIQIKSLRPECRHIAWASKGYEQGTARLLHQCAEEVLGQQVSYAVLSGPTFAKEMAQGLPTAATVASNDEAYADRLAAIFHGGAFRIYTSDDVIGVELGGAVKNVFAIAAGISDGLGFGANARAALITRGVAEMMRLGVAMGGQRETFMGLTGMGDLLMTCTDNQSRNRRLGIAVGQGKDIAQALIEIDQVVEGIQSASETYALAQRMQIEMPIVEQVYQVLNEGCSPMEAVKHLLQREVKPETVSG